MKRLKNVWKFCMGIALLAGMFSLNVRAENVVEANGTCGENLIWELDSTGVLTISGEGNMEDYEWENPTCPWYEYRNNITNVDMNEGITHIGDAAFYSCTSVTNIAIPDTVTSIGDYAFDSCAMKSIELPEGLVEIGKYAFHKSMVTSIIIPEGVNNVGEGAFAFSNLTDAVLPRSLTYIPNSMFKYSYYLQNVNFENTLKTIGDLAFAGCYGLNSIVLPEGLISIGNHAFSTCGPCDLYAGYYDCNNFTSVTLPSTLESIGKQAFYYCQSLQTITIPDKVKSLGNYTFGYCYRLNSVVLSANLEEIKADAFMGCKALKNITFRWNAPTINSIAFGRQVVATCYYPENNPEWTEDMRQNYGGTLTWVAQTMEEPKVETIVAITEQPTDHEASVGDTAVFSVKAVGDGLSYQWKYSNSNGKYWYDSGMEGYKTSELAVPVTKKRDGQLYKCIVTDQYGNEAISEQAVLSVIQTELQLEITKQPENQEVENESFAVFTVEANGDSLTYQWQYSNNEGKYWYNSGLDGAKTCSIQVEALKKRDGQQYRCKITDKNGDSITSDIATLTLVQANTIVIVEQPQNVNTTVGTDAVFTVEATGNNLTYQWKYTNKTGKYWYNSTMDGATTNTITIPATAKRNGQQYKCVIKDENGNEIVTNAVLLTVN